MKYIKKDKQPIMVYTDQYRIKGNIYFVPGTRLTDVLNIKVKDFIPLTEVTVYDAKENAILAEVPYLAVYRDSIVAVHPIEENEMQRQAKAAEEEEDGR